MPRPAVPRVIATLVFVITFLALSVASASAQEQPEQTINPVKAYAGVLRAINPHLPDWQRRKYAASVLANAERTKVDPRFIMAIVTVESSWRSNAVSHSGARGLGQLMPSTAARLDVNARDAAENLRGTASYLKSLLDRFRGQQHWFEKAIAGYNAGPNAVKKYGGIPPFAETQRYVVKVLRVYTQLYGSLAIAWSPYISHHRELPSSDVSDQPTAPSDSALSGIVLLPIPDFKSSF